MGKRTKYDLLHDRYYKIRTTKSGTRYERLAAFVFKDLDESGLVIHDLKLNGNTGVKHQIDVNIEKDGRDKKVLIECKDFDISGKKVGLDIVRSFWAVIDDTKPDEAIIITCNGFTKDAQIYAKGKGIKLVVLREFQEEDWEGRVKKVAINMQIYSLTEPNLTVNLSKQEYVDKFQQDMNNAGILSFGIWKSEPVFINSSDQRIQLNEFVETKLNDYPRENPGPVEYKIPLENATIEVESRGAVPIAGLELRFVVIHSHEYFEVTSKKVAELIITGLEDDDFYNLG